eukprot:7126699-Alexandrium_andersonii.AAC.1
MRRQGAQANDRMGGKVALLSMPGEIPRLAAGSPLGSACGKAEGYPPVSYPWEAAFSLIASRIQRAAGSRAG